MKDKKGQLGGIGPGVIALMIVAIVLGITLTILASFATGLTGTAKGAITNTSAALSGVGVTWMPIDHQS